MYIDEILKFKSEAFRVYFSFAQKYFGLMLLCHRKCNTAGCLAYR